MSRCMECVAATVSVRPSQLAAVLYRARERSRGGPSLISLMVSVDVRHHAYLLTLDQEKGGGWSWVLIAGWIVLLLTEPSRDQDVLLLTEPSSGQEQGGGWSWVLIAGWIVLLLTEPSRGQEQGGGWSWVLIDGRIALLLSCSSTVAFRTPSL